MIGIFKLLKQVSCGHYYQTVSNKNKSENAYFVIKDIIFQMENVSFIKNIVVAIILQVFAKNVNHNIIYKEGIVYHSIAKCLPP